ARGGRPCALALTPCDATRAPPDTTNVNVLPGGTLHQQGVRPDGWMVHARRPVGNPTRRDTRARRLDDRLKLHLAPSIYGEDYGARPDASTRRSSGRTTLDFGRGGMLL